jgi:hypothetical protein
MFPVRDDNPRRYPCVVTWSIIGINVLVFIFEASKASIARRRSPRPSSTTRPRDAFLLQRKL